MRKRNALFRWPTFSRPPGGFARATRPSAPHICALRQREKEGDGIITVCAQDHTNGHGMCACVSVPIFLAYSARPRLSSLTPPSSPPSTSPSQQTRPSRAAVRLASHRGKTWQAGTGAAGAPLGKAVSVSNVCVCQKRGVPPLRLFSPPTLCPVPTHVHPPPFSLPPRLSPSPGPSPSVGSCISTSWASPRRRRSWQHTPASCRPRAEEGEEGEAAGGGGALPPRPLRLPSRHPVRPPWRRWPCCGSTWPVAWLSVWR